MRNNSRCFHWVMGLVCGVFAVSCDYLPVDNAVRFDSGAYNRERALWEAQHISDYVFTEIYFPDCPAGNVRVTVSGNEAVRFESLEGGEDYTLFAETIDGIYEQIETNAAYWEERFRTGDSPYRAVRFDISYNEVYHFPQSVRFSIAESGVDGGWYDVVIEDFVTAEIASQKQEIFDIAAFNREKRLWEEQNIENYTFTQTHESNFVKTPATASFAVSVSGSVPVSGDENDILLCYAGSIPLVYSCILSEFKYWRSELYKNDGYVSVICAISYDTEWHYPESVRFRVESASGDAVRWEYLDIVAFKK